MNDADPRDRLYQGKFQPQALVHGLSYDLERPLLHCDNKTITAGEFRDLTSQYCQAFGAAGMGKALESPS